VYLRGSRTNLQDNFRRAGWTYQQSDINLFHSGPPVTRTVLGLRPLAVGPGGPERS
jgi:hypothetical protein